MMALAIVPLAIRMGLVHVILKFGTNNQVALELTDDEIWERSVGSRLVLASRIFYSALYVHQNNLFKNEFFIRE